MECRVLSMGVVEEKASEEGVGDFLMFPKHYEQHFLPSLPRGRIQSKHPLQLQFWALVSSVLLL